MRWMMGWSVALLVAVAINTVEGALEGLATDLAMMTDASDPPSIRALNLRTLDLMDIFTYRPADLLLRGVNLVRPDGRNRTLRPAGIALLEETYTDTVYWSDAGAGAILGMRFDSSGLRVLQVGLDMPESLVLDSRPEAYQTVGGFLLYWGDSGTNRIQRCTIVPGGLGGAGNCSATTDVLANGVAQVAGLALDGATSTLYWADAYAMRIRSAKVDLVTGRADVPLSLAEVVSYVAMPSAIALEPAVVVVVGGGDDGGGGGGGDGGGGGGDGSIATPARLYVLDQASPASLSRVWLSGSNGTQVLIPSGLSRPRAVGLARDQQFYLVLDSGRGSVLLARTSEDAPAPRVVYSHPAKGGGAFQPRGVAIRTDAQVLISLGGATAVPTTDKTLGDAQDSAAPAARGHTTGTLATTGAAALLAGSLLLLPRRGRSPA
jgi:hypothetical protein